VARPLQLHSAVVGSTKALRRERPPDEGLRREPSVKPTGGA
jgi:hypothetical protein